jgi:hypothetical protein
MKSLSHASFKSFAAVAVAFLFIASSADASDCDSTCRSYATQASNAAKASASQQVATSCGQNAQSQADFYACMSAGQPYVEQAGQSAYNSVYSQCMMSCRSL